MAAAKQEIAKDILDNQTAKQLLVVRGKLYELLVNCLPPDMSFSGSYHQSSCRS